MYLDVPSLLPLDPDPLIFTNILQDYPEMAKA